MNRTADKQWRLSDFLWKEVGMFDQDAQQKHFRRDGFGRYVLKRQGVVSAILQTNQKQLTEEPANSTSIYLSGCRGMGKTCDLMLIARELTSKGWEVYWFKTARSIPERSGAVFEAYIKENSNKKIAVLIDEVHTDPNSDIFTSLLKDAPPNVLTIGAAVPRYLPTGGTAQFRAVLRSPDLILKDKDEDVRELIKHWKRQNVTSPETVEYVSKFLLDHCGGHVYPVLAFMEHFFTNDETKKFLTDTRKFRRHFNSPEFAQSEVYHRIGTRCFDQMLDPDIAATVSRVLGGGEQDGDIGTLSRLGWWDLDKQSIISSLLLNICLGHVKRVAEKAVYLDDQHSPQENMEKLLSEGLYRMEPHELVCTTNSTGWPIENALSFNWARSVKAHFANVHLEFQKPINGRWMDFYVNGLINGGLEMLRNATQTASANAKAGSQDIDQHLQRFVSGDYAEEHFALFNFAMDGKIVLPKDTAHHGKVYTYDHSTNSLYRGNERIRSPAVAKLKCQTPLSRHYTTAAGPAHNARHLLALSIPPRAVLRGFGRFFSKF
jgi:hypothetical protein